MVVACATNTLHSAAFGDVCSHFSIVHSSSSRLFVFRLTSSDLHKLLNSWYSGPTVARVCPCSSSVGMSCDPHRHSTVFMSKNYFTNFWIVLELKELCHQQTQSLNTDLLIPTSLSSLSSLYVNTKSATG